MSQNAEVLRLLRSAGRLGITPAFALERIGTMRLAARIAELRADGHRIDTTYVTSPSRGRTARYARYVLVEQKPQQLALGIPSSVGPGAGVPPDVVPSHAARGADTPQSATRR